MRHGQRVVDADCHQMEPDEMWEKYIEPKYRDAVPRQVEFKGRNVIAIEGELVASEGKGDEEKKYAYSTEEFQEAVERAMKTKHGDLMKTGFSAKQRLK